MSHELSIECGCLLRGNRVIVPASLRVKVVEVLHVDHLQIQTTEDMTSSGLDPYPWPEVTAMASEPHQASSMSPVEPTAPAQLRRSSRQGHPPDRYSITVNH